MTLWTIDPIQRPGVNGIPSETGLENERSLVSPRRSLSVSLGTSITSLYVGAYVALTLVFGSLSYGQLNLRVANIMLGLVPFIGWPAIVGQTLGVLVTASVSPLGPIDFVNILPAFAFSWLIWKLRHISVFAGLTCYSLGLGVSVSFVLQYVSGVAILILFPYVTAGIFATTTGLGYVLYRSLSKTGILKRYFP
jgi:hypothetical protein